MKHHIVCIASEFKGNEFLDEAHNSGWDVTLVTRKKLLDEPWTWTAISEVKTVEDYAPADEYVRAVVNIAGTNPIDQMLSCLPLAPLALRCSALSASSIVLNTGTPVIFSPPLPGVTPATTRVPSRTICSA